jgi:precorrin-6B methylase 2
MDRLIIDFALRSASAGYVEIGSNIAVGKWFKRLRYALRRHGPVDFIWLVGYNLVYYILRRDRNPGQSGRADLFDEKYGTDTGGVREIGSLDLGNVPAARYAVRYDPSNPELVHDQLARLQINYARFVFIDFGSGKGGVLLAAAAFPFKEVIGVELSHELHDIALQNIARFSPDETRAGRIASIHGDAAAFAMPQSDIVCYFYNPFGPPIMEKVVERLTAHAQQHGYRVIIIYVDARHPEIFARTGNFAVLGNDPDVLVLTTHEDVVIGTRAPS